MFPNSVGARKLAALLVAVMLSGTYASLIAVPAGASTLVAVGHGDLSPCGAPTTYWYSSNDGDPCASGDVSFVSGPATPPSGTGSARIATALTTDRSLIANVDPAYGGIRFDSITTLQYSTYRSSVDAGNNLAIALQFDADYDVTDSTTSFQGRVVFEPYQTFSGGVPRNTWQTWNPLTGRWWGSSSSPKVGDATVAQHCPQSSPCTWTQLLGYYPDAGLRPAPTEQFLFKAGNTWPGFVGNVDDFTIGVNGTDTTYDFEPIYCTTDCYVSPTGNDSNSGFANDPLLTVQKGVNTVSPGGTVHVAAGTYNERVTVNKSITLLGAQAGIDARARSGSESILAPANVTPAGQTPLWVSASDVTIDGFTVEGNTYVPLVGAGVYLQPGTHGSQFVNNIVENNVVGLFLANNNGGDPTLVQHNLFENNTNPGSASANDIYADNYTAGGAINGATIDSNTFTNSSYVDGGVGIDLENTTAPTQFSHITISNNAVDNHGRGVIFTGTSDSSVTGNSFTPGPTSQVGVYVWDGSPYFSVSNSNISVSANVLGCPTTCAGAGVNVGDPGATGIAVNRNDLTGLAPGITSTATATVNGTCNWWGSAGGPGVGATGGTGAVTTSPWLISSDLTGDCPPPPQVSVTLDASPDGNAGWFKTAPVPGHVSATAFGGETVTSIDCNVATVATGLGTPAASATFAVSAEGSSSVDCTATDSTATTSPPASSGVMLDTIAPGGSVTIDGGATTTGNVSATLGVSATDTIGVTAYRVANGSDCSTAAWVPVSSTTSLSTTAPLTLLSGIGVKTVCAEYEDAAGNISTTATATIGLLGVTQIATGTDHTCALMSDGTARCWGSNMYGQLGDGTKTNRLVPVVVENQSGTGPLTDIIQISAGASHTCVVRSAGSVRCWGLNSNGQLGDGTTTNRSLPVAVKDPTGVISLTGVTQISISGVFSCARISDGTARCWGNNINGQLGDGTTTSRLLPVTVANQTGTGPLTDISQISVRGVHSCVLRSAGSVRCWGLNTDGRLGDGTTTNRLLPVVVKDPTGIVGLSGVIGIVNGSTYTCAVVNDGTARCWGDNASGELGDGTSTDRLLPVVVLNQTGTGPLSGLVQIAAGSQHTCALRSVGAERCWGSNTNGQLGDGTTTGELLPVVVKNLNTITQISLRNDTSCAVLTDGTVRCWGSNAFGQLGDGTTTAQPLAVPVVIP